MSVCLFFTPLSPQQCFMMPQSLGVIGGKPNSAHYFIGFVGKPWSIRIYFFLVAHLFTSFYIITVVAFQFLAGTRLYSKNNAAEGNQVTLLISWQSKIKMFWIWIFLWMFSGHLRNNKKKGTSIDSWTWHTFDEFITINKVKQTWNCLSITFFRFDCSTFCKY